MVVVSPENVYSLTVSRCHRNLESAGFSWREEIVRNETKTLGANDEDQQQI